MVERRNGRDKKRWRKRKGRDGRRRREREEGREERREGGAAIHSIICINSFLTGHRHWVRSC